MNEYTYEKSKELAATYYRGVETWLENNFMPEKERDTLAERFWVMLSLYKDLVNGVADINTNGGDINGERITKSIEDIKAWAGSLPSVIQGKSSDAQ
jgi:hypothetical protein